MIRIAVFILVISSAFASCPCMIDRERLGHSTWYLLHEIAKTNPDENQFNQFMTSLSHLYPCKVCRKHFQHNLNKYSVFPTPLSMCNFHNIVNAQLDKKEYNCSIYIQTNI